MWGGGLEYECTDSNFSSFFVNEHYVLLAYAHLIGVCFGIDYTFHLLHYPCICYFLDSVLPLS